MQFLNAKGAKVFAKGRGGKAFALIDRFVMSSPSRSSYCPECFGSNAKAPRFPRRPRIMSSRISDLKISDLRSPLSQSLIVISMQQPALIQILTSQTMPGPRHSFKALFQDRFTAMNALAVRSIGDSMQDGDD